MGDIAEMMLDGTLCQGCGEFLGGDDGLPGYCAGCAPRPSRAKRKPEPVAATPRKVRTYLREVSRAPDGRSVRPSEWNDLRFQACLAAGWVTYEKPSNRWRTVRITDAGRAALTSEARQ
jgi:hypothetical protein